MKKIILKTLRNSAVASLFLSTASALFLSVASALFLSVASAHTPYLAPSSFEPVHGNYVTLDASFAETFFVPEVAFVGGVYQVTAPNGEVSAPDSLTEFKTRVALEHQLKDKGTYKFTTGYRLGKTFKIYELDGKRGRMKDPSKPIPEGAKMLRFFQSVTIAAAYVTRGAPDNGAIKAGTEGLEILPITHPNDIFAGDGFTFKVLFNGKAVNDLSLNVYKAEGAFSPKEAAAKLTTNETGEVTFTPKDAGRYLVTVRHLAKSPEGSVAPKYSHTYTLAIEAAR